MQLVYLSWYCVLILLASVGGGMIPDLLKLTHRRLEIAVSFVAGVMLGVALLHMLPHALAAAITQSQTATGGVDENAVLVIMLWLIAGFLVMFLIERFFSYHHHDVPEDEEEAGEPFTTGLEHAHGVHDHHHITWSGAAIGLSLHSILAGMALAASVFHGSHQAGLPGLGTFLVIFLHKPLDSATIAMLMARGGWSPTWRNIVNGLFALAIPLGAALFQLALRFGANVSAHDPVTDILPGALAFSAGMFLCVAMSDLLPELQFHQHDRLKLTVALVLGLAVAYGAQRLEATHLHHHDAHDESSAFEPS